MTDDNADSQFRAMADFLPQLVWFTDHRGGTIWYNRRWYEYTGSNPDAMEGWGWVGAVHPDHAERALKGFRDAWEAGTAWEDTYPLRRHDGEYHWFLARAAPFRDSRGKLVRWLGTNTDINDRIEAERLQKLLTREVNHRVKNNLALVAGLLNMQARDLRAKPVRQLAKPRFGSARSHKCTTCSGATRRHERSILGCSSANSARASSTHGRCTG
jgi:PAS domain S-box-containing protein